MERSIEALKSGGSSARPPAMNSPSARGLILVVVFGAAVLGQWFDGAAILLLFFLRDFLQEKCLRRVSNFVRPLQGHVGDEVATRIATWLQESPSPKSFHDRFFTGFVQVYTPAMVVFALLVAAGPPIFFGGSFAPWISRGVILLVLAGPWTFTLSTPVAIAATLKHGLKNGILFKGSGVVEGLATVDTILLDSAGTLTQEGLHVTDILPANGWSEAEVLAMAAGVEWVSDHPVGSAIVSAALQAGVELVHVSSVETFPGLGARGTVNGHTVRVGNLRYLRRESVDVSGAFNQVERLEVEGKHVVGLADGLLLVGLIALAHVPDEESLRAVLRLMRIEGIDRLEMISGSNEAATRWLAAQFGIDHVRSELLPEDKMHAVESLQRTGRKVAIVADGLRDQAALGKADVGVAVCALGPDCLEKVFQSADVLLFKDDLSRLPYALLLARRMVRILRQNIVIAMGIKVLALSLLARGDLTLWSAALMDTGVALFVCLNGMRLLRRVRIPAVRMARG